MSGKTPLIIEGLAYPPGVTPKERDAFPIYVPEGKLEEFAKTAVGKPLNLNHPNAGDPSDSNRIGVVQKAWIDEETGGIKIRARLDSDTAAGWSAYEKVKSGTFPQLSIGNRANRIFNEEETRYEAVDHVVDEISCVEQGDNELGRGFKTDITHLSELPASHLAKKKLVDSAIWLGSSLRTSVIYASGNHR